MKVSSPLKHKRDPRFSRLLDTWNAPEGAGKPVACVATSFTFDAAFFEEECLARFLRLDTDPVEDGVAYLLEREEKLADAGVAALVDHRHADPVRSLRWDLLPVRVPGAAQHSKVTLLAWEGAVRLTVASANLTEPGYRKNLEVFASLDYSAGSDAPLDVLTSAVAFVRGVAFRYTPGDSRADSAKSRALGLLRRIERIASGLGLSKPSKKVQIKALFSGDLEGGRHRVLEWLGEQAEKYLRPQSAVVVSPFFDQENTEAHRALSEVMLKTGDRRVDFVTNGGVLEDGRARLHAPRWLATAGPERMRSEFHLVAAAPNEEARNLHAKALLLERAGAYTVAVVGSSNFTRAGLGLGDGPVNLEANLAFFKRHSRASNREMAEVIPATYGPFDIDEIVFDPQEDPELAESADSILPAGFEEALFGAEPAGAELVLRFRHPLPFTWGISASTGEPLVRSDEVAPVTTGAWEKKLPWQLPHPPSFVVVRWVEDRVSGAEAAAVEEREAKWVVNVTDPSLLPPPDELRDLTLATLLSILASGRPVHEILARLNRHRRNNGGSGTTIDPALDPLKRYRDETHLIYRTRAVARALEQLRVRLERPALLESALKWRLEGPVGPVALARALVREARSPAEGAFLVAEVLLTLASSRVLGHPANIPRRAINKCWRGCAELLRAEIDDASLKKSHPKLAEYVEQVLKKAGL